MFLEIIIQRMVRVKNIIEHNKKTFGCKSQTTKMISYKIANALPSERLPHARKHCFCQRVKDVQHTPKGGNNVTLHAS
jgi:hypothetical protein